MFTALVRAFWLSLLKQGTTTGQSSSTLSLPTQGSLTGSNKLSKFSLDLSLELKRTLQNRLTDRQKWLWQNIQIRTKQSFFTNQLCQWTMIYNVNSQTKVKWVCKYNELYSFGTFNFFCTSKLTKMIHFYYTFMLTNNYLQQ